MRIQHLLHIYIFFSLIIILYSFLFHYYYYYYYFYFTTFHLSVPPPLHLNYLLCHWPYVSFSSSLFFFVHVV